MMEPQTQPPWNCRSCHTHHPECAPEECQRFMVHKETYDNCYNWTHWDAVKKKMLDVWDLTLNMAQEEGQTPMELVKELEGLTAFSPTTLNGSPTASVLGQPECSPEGPPVPPVASKKTNTLMDWGAG